MTKPAGNYDAVLSANDQYAKDFGDKANLALPPARHFAILTCMDAGSILPNMPASLKATRTSSATLAAAPPTTQSAPW